MDRLEHRLDQSQRPEQRPRRLVIPALVPSRVLAAGEPKATITLGRIVSICRKRNGEHVATSSGCGSRFPGGRHFTTFAM